jgi:hypothetical protein
MKQWIYTPTASYVYMACCLSTSDNFMFMITIIKHHVIKVFGQVEVCLQALLTLALDKRWVVSFMLEPLDICWEGNVVAIR